MEKLIIRNFAGIHNLEMELGKINLLLGPQASGKSVSVKLIYFFKNLIKDIGYYSSNGKTFEEINDLTKEKFYRYFPPHTWNKEEEFRVEYYQNGYWIKVIQTRNQEIDIKYHPKIKALIHTGISIFENLKTSLDQHQIDESLFFIEFNNKFRKYTHKTGIKYPHINIFIPSGRSFFSYIQANIFHFIQNNIPLDPFLVQFGSIYERSKTLDYQKNIHTRHSKDDDIFHYLLNRIINGKFVHINDKDIIQHKDGRAVEMLYASSGQQEILPLLVILENQFFNPAANLSTKLFIEEPEAHLFPKAQYDVVKLLAHVFNSGNHYQYFITTHSPYILAAFNNLLYAGMLEEKLSAKQDIYSVIPKGEILAPGTIKAYELEHGGHLKSIMDPESGLIDQNVLDTASEDIAEEFEKLLQLEFAS